MPFLIIEDTSNTIRTEVPVTVTMYETGHDMIKSLDHMRIYLSYNRVVNYPYL
jgi:hypothetical protein